MLASAVRLARTLGLTIRTLREPQIDALLLLLAKFVLYYLVAAQAPRLLHVSPANRTSFATLWAGLRLGLGLLATYPIILLLGLADRLGLHALPAYLLVLGVVRVLLWALTASLVLQMHRASEPPRIKAWVLLGVVCSFTVDLTAWLLDADLKFFC